MFLEKLRDLGETVLRAKFPANLLLKWVTDPISATSFFETVIVLEVSFSGGFRVEAFPLATIGTIREVDSTNNARQRRKPKRIFEIDSERSLAFPVFLPPSGNPLVPQGKYPVPVFLAYEKNLSSLADDPSKFLQRRLDRTIGIPKSLSPVEMEEISSKIKPLAQQALERFKKGESLYNKGILALIIPQTEGPYFYAEKRAYSGDPNFVTVGSSQIFPGSFIIANLEILLDLVLKAKMEEGADYGTASVCSLCGKEERCVSAYSKSFPWLAPTWHAPFPEEWKHGGEVKNLAATVAALCSDCYKALTVGATFSQIVSSRLPNWLVKEIFSSTDLPSEKIQSRQAENITGCMLITPILNEEDYENTSQALLAYVNKNSRIDKKDFLLKPVLGYEACLPEEFNSENFLVTLFYYTETNADIKLRTVVEDVFPSTLSQLSAALSQAINQNSSLREALHLPWGNDQREKFSSLLYLLARAYGIGNTWQAFEKLLRARELDLNIFYKFLAGQMNYLAKRALTNREFFNLGVESGKNYFDLKWKVFFKFLFLTTYSLFQERLKKKGGKNLLDWQEFGKKICDSPPQALNFTSPEEIGFASGVIIRAFSRIYYAVTQKDFLQHRILTFGESLNPEKIWLKAQSKLPEYAEKVRMSHSEKLNRILEVGAVISCAFQNLKEEIRHKNAEFMANFWSGYVLSDKIWSFEEARKGGEA